MMSDQHSPWARPGSDAEPGGVILPPGPPVPVGAGAIELGEYSRAGISPPPPVAAPAGRGRPGSRPIELSGGAAPADGWSRTGAVTGLGQGAGPAPDVLRFGPPRRPEEQRRRMFRVFGGVAGGICAIGLAVLVLLTMTGHSPLHRDASGPPDVLPPLAKACPPPSVGPDGLPPAPPAPPGPRITDPDAGISYAAQGTPWTAWHEVWSAGDLRVRYAIGQHFITETYTDGFGQTEQYHASILSGSVPAAANDALTLDLKCTGHQVLADVRQSYYPQPNTIEMMRDEVTTLGGRPAWVSKFRLHFRSTGLRATDELVGLALIDVGRPNAAILYISIPGTVRQYDQVVDEELASVRPT